MFMIKKLMVAGMAYIREMDLKDMAVLKFCLISFGTLLGIAIPAKGKRTTALFAASVFIATLFAVMHHFFAALIHVRED